MIDQRATIAPKVELHLHLDCSLSYESVKILDPGIDEAEYRERYLAPKKCYDLVDYFRYLVAPQSLLQTEAALEVAIGDLMRQLVADGVVYAEIRFAPHLHIVGGLQPAQVVEAVLKGRRKAMSHFAVETRLILCTLRHYDTERGMEVLELAERYRDEGVAGIDLAGDEAGFALEPHIPVFQQAASSGINITAHAGEAAGAQSVREVIEKLGVRRVGHGVRSIEDQSVVDLIVQEKVHLEVCPSCNIQIDVFRTYEEHPVDALAKNGVSLGINTDARGPTDLTLEVEYDRLAAVFGWTAQDFRLANLNALEAAFIDDRTRSRLKDFFN